MTFVESLLNEEEPDAVLDEARAVVWRVALLTVLVTLGA